MAFLTPGAFFLLALLPLLFLPYLLRERGKRIIVSGLFLYQGIRTAAPHRLWGRLKLSPLFFLQLLILLLLVFTAAQPFLTPPTHRVAIILDNSASMQAGQAFDLAKEKAIELAKTLPPSASLSLFLTSPYPTAVSRGLRALSPSDTSDPPDHVLSAFLDRLLRQGYEKIFLLTDRKIEGLEGENILAISFGKPQANLAISSFRLYRSPFLPQRVDAAVTVESFAAPQGVTLTIENLATGEPLASRTLRIDASTTQSFTDLPPVSLYRATLRAEEDALSLDNQAYGVLRPLEKMAVLVVSPDPNAARSLQQIPNLDLHLLSPAEYAPDTASDFPLVLFHLTAPQVLPATDAALIFPPPDNDLFPLGKRSVPPAISYWISPHPLTTYINFRLLSPPYAQAFHQPSWCEGIIFSPAGPLLLAGEKEGKRYAALGFDILPYLGEKNLPSSILTLNLLSWLVRERGVSSSIKTGEPIPLSPLRSLRTPGGELLHLEGPQFANTFKQGVYFVQEQNGERPVAVNLASKEESQLARPLTLARSSRPHASLKPTRIAVLWPWLLLAALLLLGGEIIMLSRQGG